MLENTSANNEGCIIWLTGLPASGKSTIAENLERKLQSQDIHAFILDGDKVRKGLNSDLGFSHADRTENIRRIGEVAKLFQMAGIVTIVAFISPYRSDRDLVRKIVEKGKFIEVFVDCPVAVCEKRDPKGHYVKAKRGEIKDFTGVSAPYELPLQPEVHLKTNVSSIDECIQTIIDYLAAHKQLPSHSQSSHRSAA